MRSIAFTMNEKLHSKKFPFPGKPTQKGFQVGLGDPMKSFRIEKSVFEGSETLKEFSIITNSEIEKDFQLKKSVFEIRKPKRFPRPTRKPFRSVFKETAIFWSV